MTFRTVASTLAGVALLVACGGGKAESPTPTAVVTGTPPSTAAETTTVTAPPPPGAGEWAKWSHDQKLAYMKTAVMPKLGAAFHDYDPKAFANPRCTLCHSTGAGDGTFKMPDPGLPKLPANPADFKAIAAKEPKLFEFMAKVVVPETASLIGVPAFDPKTNAGFGCYDCHTKQ